MLTLILVLLDLLEMKEKYFANVLDCREMKSKDMEQVFSCVGKLRFSIFDSEWPPDLLHDSRRSPRL